MGEQSTVHPSQHLAGRSIADQITPPDPMSSAAARRRLEALAKPIGSLGRLEDLAAWLAGCQALCPPRPLERVRAVVFAGDHGVARYGVSAYPQRVTPAMVRALCAGTAAASVLARQHGIPLQVYDLAVDDDLGGVPEEVTRYKVRRGSEPIHLADALTRRQGERAWSAGVAIGEQLIGAGIDLLVIGDLGIGNTTPAACLIAAALELPGEEVTGRGTGLDDQGLQHKITVVDSALRRVGSRVDDPWQRLLALGSADMVAAVATMITSARGGVPILLDGLVAVAEAVTADALAPGLMAWCVAGHRSTEPAQRLALEKFGLEPVLDASMRLGEGSGALATVPLLRSAALLINEMALLTEVS